MVPAHSTERYYRARLGCLCCSMARKEHRPWLVSTARDVARHEMTGFVLDSIEVYGGCHGTLRLPGE